MLLESTAYSDKVVLIVFYKTGTTFHYPASRSTLYPLLSLLTLVPYKPLLLVHNFPLIVSPISSVLLRLVLLLGVPGVLSV